MELHPKCFLVEQFGSKDLQVLKRNFSALYASIGLAAPVLIILQNPVEYQWAQYHLKTGKADAHLGTREREGVQKHRLEGKAPRSVNLKLWSKIGDTVARSLYSAFGDESELQAHHHQWQAIFQTFEDAINRKLEAEFGAHQLKVALADHHPNWLDYKWLAYYYKQFQHVDLAEELWAILEAGLMKASCYEGLVLVCLKPRQVQLDEGRLHNEEGPALSWDGLKLYYWRGIPVPEKLIESPEEVSRADIDRYQNAEVRRCFQEALGGERFAALFDLEMIDSDFDLQGNKQFLYRSREVDPVAKEYLQFAKVTCPSTHRNYFLCVPPDIKDVWQAVAWTFSKEKEDYRPSREV